MKTSLMIMYIALIVCKSGDAFVPEIKYLSCTDADPIPTNLIQLSYTTLKEDDGNWILLYNISWEPPSQYESLVYAADLQIETNRTSLTPWVFANCKEALQEASERSQDELTQSATITREAPFTHNALFQLGYAATSEGLRIPISSVSQKEFETPDCYMETRDAIFCAAQSVVRCGMPIHVLLKRVEYSSENNIVMMFSWCPPIQVNQMRSLSQYQVQLHTIDGGLLLNDSIQHESDSETYYWRATSPEIQEGNQYKLTIVPYLSDSYGDDPGRLFTQSFAAIFFEEDPIPPNLIQLNYTTLKEADGNWILLYNISWEPPSQYESLVYAADLQIETTRTSLTPLVFANCKEALQEASERSQDELTMSATFSKEAPFTHNALFQLAFVATSEGYTLPVSPTSQKEFETPDCYMETRDAIFCAAQSVVRCGMPIHVLLKRVENSSENNIVMMFSWCPPIQVNQMSSLSQYQVQLHTIDGGLLLNDSIQHESDNETYYWRATSPEIQEGNQYKLTIVPYLSDSYGDDPGRLFTQSFEAIFFEEETTVDPECGVTSTVSLNRNNAAARPKDPPPGQPQNLPPHSPTASSPTTVIAVVLLVGLVVVLIICTVCILWTRIRRRETNDRLEKLHLEQMKQEKAIEKTREIDPILKDKEISHDHVIIEQKLGEGEFGLVHLGKVTGMKNKVDDVVVAIKTTKVGAFDEVKEDLLNEMKLIAELGDHVNILCLLACCSMNEPFYLITEYMKYGDLLGFLRECRRTENSEKDQIYSVKEKQQLIIARDIANGMTHIQEKRFYHGDLAARNVLVGEGLTIKISDFGLADDIYTRGYKRRATEQKIPVKWCSLETILNGICSSEGDSWSFGVLLYEIFTLGGTPYPGIAPRLLVSRLKNGYRMDQPGSCPDDIYDLMKRCWQEAPHSRPRFEHMFEEIGDMLMKRSDYVEFDGEDFLQNEELLELERRGSTSLKDYHISKLAPILDEDSQVDFDELQVAFKNPLTNKEDTTSM